LSLLSQDYRLHLSTFVALGKTSPRNLKFCVRKSTVYAQRKARTKENEMRSLLGLFTFLASLIALVIAGNFEIHRRPSFSKRHAQARVVRELETPKNGSSSKVAGLGARDLERRFDGVRFTYYDAGKGACGRTNTNSDFVSRPAHLAIHDIDQLIHRLWP
jgi:hypothetical protein